MMSTNNAEKTQKMGLTKRQREYLEWIKEYMATHAGEAPTYEEISIGMGTRGGSAQSAVSGLIKRGHLVQIKGSTRSIALAE